MDISELFSTPQAEIQSEETDEQRTDIFYIVKCITTIKHLDFNNNVIKKTYNQYMINKILSMNDELFYVAELVNTIRNLTDEQHFDLLKSVIPKGYYPCKYIKKHKDTLEQKKRYIAHYFEIGIKDAEEYIKFMDDADIKKIVDKYTYGKNETIKI